MSKWFYSILIMGQSAIVISKKCETELKQKLREIKRRSRKNINLKLNSRSGKSIYKIKGREIDDKISNENINEEKFISNWPT